MERKKENKKEKREGIGKKEDTKEIKGKNKKKEKDVTRMF